MYFEMVDPITDTEMIGVGTSLRQPTRACRIIAVHLQQAFGGLGESPRDAMAPSSPLALFLDEHHP
jgi:hypothetical protein